MKNQILVAAIFVAASGQAFAQSAPGSIERYTYTYVTPGAPDFSASSFVYNNTINFDGTAGSIFPTVNFQSVATGIDLYGQGSTTIDPTSAPDHTPFVVTTIDSPGGSGQGWGFDYNGVASATAGSSFLTFGVVSGHYALTFSGGGTNLVDAGGRFLSSVIIDGDWSDPASHTTATYSAGYFIDSDFVYDSGSNKTVFTIETDDYQTGTDPSISFALLGGTAGAVPEPSTWAMMSLGLAGIGFLGLRARRGRLASA
jgi:hypothetical protein